MTDKGTTAERNLVNLLDDAGFAVMRSPASGAATQRAQPDVLAGDGTNLYAFEAKRFSGSQTYLSQDEVMALREFAENMGAIPAIAGRPNVNPGDRAWGNDDVEPWFFIHPSRLRKTEGGNLALSKRRLQEAAKRLSDLIEISSPTPEKS